MKTVLKIGTACALLVSCSSSIPDQTALDKVDWSSPKLRDALNKQAEELLHAMDRLEPGSVWPQARTMMLRKAEAAEWKAELKEQTCSTLVLGYCGKVAVEQYHFVDVALRVKDPALCASLLELARKEPVTKCIVTTMYNPLIVLALNGAGKPVAAFTMTDGSMQPIRVGRHDGRWVFDNWFMPPVYNLRLRNRRLEIMLRNMVGEAGRRTDD